MLALARDSASGLTLGSVDNIYAKLPAGLVGDPNAVPKCTSEQFDVIPQRCPVASQVGVLHLELDGAALGGTNLGPFQNERTHPVFNLEPRKGRAAELGFAYASGESATAVRLTAKARTNGDFGVTTFIGQIPAVLPVRSQTITLWGVPWATANDRWRVPMDFTPSDSDRGCNLLPQMTKVVQIFIPTNGFHAPGCAQSYDPSWGPIKPFISNLTECTGGNLSTQLSMDSYQNPGAFTSEADPDLSDADWRTYESPAPPMEGCDKVPFGAGIDLRTTSSAADSASGLSVDLGLLLNDDPPLPTPAPRAAQAEVADYVADTTAHWKSDAGRASSQLDKSVVTLPQGFSVNPSFATGLAGCSDAGIGVREQGNPMLFNNGDPFDGDPSDGAECPQASIIGSVEVETPILDEPLTGRAVLGDPKSTDPTSGEMFRMFLYLEDEERGLAAKVYGSAVADPNTGQLTATFDKNPRVPFENLHLELSRGDRGILALPQRCGAHGWQASFSPWSAAHGAGGTPVADSGEMTADQNCGFGFAPAMNAGMDNDRARGSGKFSFRFSRPDGQQWLRGLAAKLPTGLLASVKDVPLCNDANAAAGTCGVESRIGSVDASAGSGTPFVLEKKGDVYLTEGYKGAPYGLSVKVPVEAGPFRGQFALSPIVVRQALYVDRTSAQVTAVSDPFPIIHHGIPLRVREVAVTVDRPGFMLNPSNCDPKRIDATFTSAEGAQHAAGSHFQAAGCGALPFKPKLKLELTGRKQTTTGKHPGVKATVTQVPGEAGVGGVVVRLPLSLALDPNNAQALCEFDDGTKDDLENHCQKGSIVGRARAVSPLLRRPLTGNVYFVKNVKRSSTGNLIRTLPMIIVALRGEIAVNLRGVSSTVAKDGRLVNTFANVPDAPIKQFNLNITGGKNGILAVTRTRKIKRLSVCNGKQVAEADFDGHNGKRFDRDITMKVPCKKQKAGKRKATKRKAANKRTKKRSSKR